MSRHTDVFDIFYITQLEVLMEVVSTWEDSEYFLEKLHRLRGTIMEKGAKAFSADPNHFNTMIHGDMLVSLTVPSLSFSVTDSVFFYLKLINDKHLHTNYSIEL